MSDRIGLFICECGPNIKDALDIPELVRYASLLENVVLAEPIRLLCAPEGQQHAADVIRANDLSHVVFAGCSPREHEPTFRNIIEAAGRNPFMMQTANLREQCAWVIHDRNQATRKAKRLIRGAIQRVRHHLPIVVREIDCRTDVLVIGGGVAGISAAKTLAQHGRRVFVVERSPCIGGMAALYEDFYPDFNCAACLIGPHLDDLLHDQRIEVLTTSSVLAVRGTLGNFVVTVRQAAQRIDPLKCMGCAACVDACPVAVPNEFNAGLDTRKAVHIPYPGSLPHVAGIDPQHCRQCRGETCRACMDACAFDAVNQDAVDTTRDLNVGAVVVATGFTEFDPGRSDRYGYGSVDNVISGLAFERLINASGPTQGKILTTDGRAPEAVAFVHCVGSRTLAFNRFCSGVCCLSSFKHARQVHEQLPTCAIHHFFVDLCLPGKTAQRLADQVRAMDGVRLHRLARPDSIRISAKNGRVRIDYTDSGGSARYVDVQMAVLATAMEASTDADQLAQILDIDLDADGFFKESHPVTDPVAATREGIYLAGSCQSPADIPTCIARGQAAAGNVLQKLVPGGKIPLEPIVAEVDPEICSGCRTCEAVCAFGAIEHEEHGASMSVDETLCRGCGVCAAGCPGGAIRIRHYSHQALCAEIEGLIKPEKA